MYILCILYLLSPATETSPFIIPFTLTTVAHLKWPPLPSRHLLLTDAPGEQTTVLDLSSLLWNQKCKSHNLSLQANDAGDVVVVVFFPLCFTLHHLVQLKLCLVVFSEAAPAATRMTSKKIPSNDREMKNISMKSHIIQFQPKRTKTPECSHLTPPCYTTVIMLRRCHCRLSGTNLILTPIPAWPFLNLIQDKCQTKEEYRE